MTSECHHHFERSIVPAWICDACGGDLSRPLCACGHTKQNHELRSTGMFGCFIVGCTCIDFTPPEAP